MRAARGGPGLAGRVIDDLGTPAPPAPAVSGRHRYVRNPVYLAVLAVIAGQDLVLGRPVLLACAAFVGTAFGAFVRWDE